MAVVDVVVESEEWESAPDIPALIETAVKAALSGANVATLPAGEIAVLLTDDEGITALNERWRGKPKATNVLSWPAVSPKLLAVSPMIGDIAIAYETAATEAEAENKAFADHIRHLAVHGALHLLGFDHEADDEAEVMEQLERQILKGLGIADPYGPAGIRKEPLA